MSNSILTLDEIIKKTSDLPSIPAAALRVIKLTDASSTTASKLAEIIAQDQSMSVRVLRLANSAFYGLSRKVGDLSEAVIILGMRTVRNLAMVASTYPWMIRPLRGYALGPKQLWTHSFGVAIGAQLVAKRARLMDEEAIFTAGLLHDIGKVALSIWLENKLTGLLTLATNENLTFDEAERQVLGYDHQDVGARLGEIWNLPDAIVAAISFHHRPDEATDHRQTVDCVHIADYMTMAMGFGLGGDGLSYRFSPNSLERLGLTESDLDSLTDDFVTQYERAEDLMMQEQGAAA